MDIYPVHRSVRLPLSDRAREGATHFGWGPDGGEDAGRAMGLGGAAAGREGGGGGEGQGEEEDGEGGVTGASHRGTFLDRASCAPALSSRKSWTFWMNLHPGEVWPILGWLPRPGPSSSPAASPFAEAPPGTLASAGSLHGMLMP